MKIDHTITLLTHANQLKQTARTGWAQRGVPQAENVAAHTFGMAFTALILAEMVTEPIDRGHLLTMALLHDLSEGLTTDIPSPAWRFLPPGSKAAAEREAMREILGEFSFSPEMLSIWEEFQTRESLTAQIVHDADKIDMFLQALIYEEQTGNKHLAEFWATPHTFRTTPAQTIYERLRERYATR